MLRLWGQGVQLGFKAWILGGFVVAAYGTAC